LLANYRSVKNDTDAATAKRRVRDSEAMVKALFEAGVPIVAGTDGALPGYSVLRSIEMYVEAGMTPMQAIESATRVPAESMGLAKDSGTIEAGKRADFIVLGGDPLSNISNIRRLNWVVANGRIMAPGNCGCRLDSGEARATFVRPARSRSRYRVRDFRRSSSRTRDPDSRVDRRLPLGLSRSLPAADVDEARR
jgi:adenine deaminase